MEQKIIHATLLFLLRDKEILLAMKKRGFGSDLYNGVGGKIDPGETVKQAAIRECQEEIGVTPHQPEKVAELEFTFDGKTEQPEPDMHVTVFISTSWDGTPVETEEMAPQWFDKLAIPYDKMWEDDPYWLPVVLAGRKINGSFVFSADNHLISSVVKSAS